MAAYGALLSLTNTMDQILNHPRPPISLDTIQIKPLTERVAFLQDFLENYIIDDADGLEGRMIDAAHEAEDIIETHIADSFEDEYEDSLYRYIQKMMEESDASHEAAPGKANISSKDNDSLYRELQKVMQDFESIAKDVAAIKDKAGRKIAPCTKDIDAMVGSNDVMNDIAMDKLNGPSSEGNDSVMNDIMDKLTNQQSNRRIIAIAGMGGIGKTTLAKSIFENPLIVEYFDLRGWATASQEFDSKRILLEVLPCLKLIKSEDNLGQMSEHELGDALYKSLFGRRYLIVMDDIWGTDAWDRVKHLFPDNNNGSRVLITTRLLKVAFQLDGPDCFQMRFLNQNDLLSWCVFREQRCPTELKEIGKEIAGKCRGLPLSIVVIGGLLAKSEQTRHNWQHIVENLSSTVNFEEDERCFRILKLSYNQLPVHLKPRFLYMGMFPEDKEICVPTLLKLWVDEGFVKPVADKSLETIARVVYLHDLLIRNLILVRGWGRTGRIKYCGIHDLLRDLCIKEAEKYKYFRTTKTTHFNPDHDQSWHAQRRISIHEDESWSEYNPRPLHEAVQSASRARTLILNGNKSLPSAVPSKLLRILNGYDVPELSAHFRQKSELGLRELFLLVNLRHLFIIAKLPKNEFPPEFYLLWNLRTLIFDAICFNRPMLNIWRMPQLRHVKAAWGLRLTDPDEEKGSMVLENLETLQSTWNLKLSEKVVERFPNIKKLGVLFNKEMELSPADYGLDNLWLLHKLEALLIHVCFGAFKKPYWDSCSIDSTKSEVAMFPVSLKKLFLHGDGNNDRLVATS